jgi:hypothetical protein
MTTAKKFTHGGARKGAGRKPKSKTALYGFRLIDSTLKGIHAALRTR